MPIDIYVILGNDEESEVTLRNVWKASVLLLRNYGIEVYVVPINTWQTDNEGLPQVIINGENIISGRVPTVSELVDIILSNYVRSKKVKTDITVPGAITYTTYFGDGALAET